ncbi:MAG: helix-turn-helix domain-containing protein [Phycisphaerales bacterium]
MNTSENIGQPADAGQQTVTAKTAVFISIDDVANMLDCSTRHVRRLADWGRIPKPVKLGAMLRWVKADLEKWVADGCPTRKSGAK